MRYQNEKINNTVLIKNRYLFPQVGLFGMLLLFALTGCKSGDKLRTSDYDYSSKENDAQLLRVDTLSGYLYDFYHDKCPGTTLSERNSPCIRKGTIFTRTRITSYSSILQDDSLLVIPDQLFVLDYRKVLQTIPSKYWFKPDSLNSSEADKRRNEIDNEAQHYLLDLLYKAEAKKPRTLQENCRSAKFKKIEIIECEIKEEAALLFSVNRPLIRYVTSPDIGIANLGMPLKFNDDSLRVAWLVPRNSPILRQNKKID